MCNAKLNRMHVGAYVHTYTHTHMHTHARIHIHTGTRSQTIMKIHFHLLLLVFWWWWWWGFVLVTLTQVAAQWRERKGGKKIKMNFHSCKKLGGEREREGGGLDNIRPLSS